eukprot:CAMPEP_0171073504 /NCGR_PEP_ID=MMETSP0766_2-20121228/11551_1 /TAXON_ID=439317 /ORGANISM="Gambierdiscus australes, Strain CAWD 149" /LENGTH=228 /DNA_ID=CAMNT_0011530207 /DNA_START=169 /DNA_END=855 /DNA_ORIENTATION=-
MAAARSRQGTRGSMNASQRRTAKKPLPEALVAVVIPGPARRRFDGRSSAASQMERAKCTEGAALDPAGSSASAAETSPASMRAATPSQGLVQRHTGCTAITPWQGKAFKLQGVSSQTPALCAPQECWTSYEALASAVRDCREVTPPAKLARSARAAIGAPDRGGVPVDRRAAMSTTESAQRPSARFSATWSQGQTFAALQLAWRTAQHSMAPQNAQMHEAISNGIPHK